MTLAELLVSAAVVFAAAWLLWDREQRQTEPSITKPAVKGSPSVRVIPPEGWKK